MPRIRSSLFAAAGAGAMLAPAAVAQGAPRTLAVEPAATIVAARDGVVLWSRFDATRKTYSLLKSDGGGALARVRVAPRSKGPFDIDLGTNASGATYAVYTRDDGDIYRLNVATGSELKVAKLSSPTLVERDPTIMRGEIAFVRRVRGQDELRIGDTSGASRGSRLIVRHRSILSAELGLTHVAYVVAGPGSEEADGAKSVRIRHLRTGADKQVYRAVSSGANDANVTRPAYVASPQGFMWARTNLGVDTGNVFVRHTLRDARLAYAPGAPFLHSTAWAGSTLGAAMAFAFEKDTEACHDETVNICRVQLSGPLQFKPGP